MNIEDIKVLDVKPNDVILVTVDLGSMPIRVSSKYMTDLRDYTKHIYPNNNVIVVPKETTIENRRVVYIDIGDMDQESALQFINEIHNKFKRNVARL